VPLSTRTVIPAEAEPAPHLMRGIQFLKLLFPVFTGTSLDSRSPIKDFEDKFHGNDTKGETPKGIFQTTKALKSDEMIYSVDDSRD